MERARRALSALLVGIAACRADRAASGAGGGVGALAYAVPGEAERGQRGERVTVEVLNASGKPGLARTGTRALRQAGIDVVFFGTASTTGGPADSTEIVVRRGTSAVGERIRRALGVGRVVVALDSARLLDASVFLGVDFAPRLEFHP